ncbi:hypothetical protein C8Q73DRAFT_669395 [Cubamyces lactineus]|nr:hypothetical protein C8Q73DRAFT_669395 [Cubamyces lactineus]
MNSFWDLVDWLLPPVRIIDDLADPIEPTHHRSRGASHSHGHNSPQVSRRTSTRDYDKEREKERERRRHNRATDIEQERGQYRQRIQHLERENDALREQLKETREELAKLNNVVFPPTPERTVPPSPCTPQDSLQPPPVLPQRPAPVHLQVAPATPAPSQAFHSAEAALSDPKRLRILYTALRATYNDARQTIISQAEELGSLKSFLSKTDDWSGAQLLQALADLNGEIVQLAASVSEEFSAMLRAHEDEPSLAKERDREVVEDALGPEMIRMLEDRIHAGDPTFVQFALQAWETRCVARVLDTFCYGLPQEVDKAFMLIFEHMHREEPQPTTSRWRALTYKHAHTLLAKPRPSTSDPPSPDSADPSPFNSAPASIASPSSLSPPLLTLTEKNLRGVIAILALAGCRDAKGLHRDPLRARFGGALSRISARAEHISNVVKTQVMSGFFEAVWVPPCHLVPKSRRSSVADGANVNGIPTKSKGKERERHREREREWVKEVEKARRADDDDEEDVPKVEGGSRFDWETMDNVFAGHGSEHCRVLCTVELGLAFRRRLPQRQREQEQESVDGDGMPISPYPRTDGEGAAASERGEETSSKTEERTLLLKPKVLLESVIDIL